jgi:hypothetical protein
MAITLNKEALNDAIMDKDKPRPFRGILAGAVGGFLGAWAMNQLHLWSKASEELQSDK